MRGGRPKVGSSLPHEQQRRQRPTAADAMRAVAKAKDHGTPCIVPKAAMTHQEKQKASGIGQGRRLCSRSTDSYPPPRTRALPGIRSWLPLPDGTP